jgi:glucan 1,3-beta-glucosidase
MESASDPDGDLWFTAHKGLAGANVGGWLLLEKWLVNGPQQTLKAGLVASPYDAVVASAEDEHGLTSQLRAAGALDAIDTFRDAYVSQLDIDALKLAGANLVRVPFGFWLAVDEAEAGGYHRGRGLAHIDDVMRWCEAAGLKVILDLHGAAGGQNGTQTCGRLLATWTPASFDHARNVRVVRAVAERYARSAALIGIELLNEPELPYATLLAFYKEAYAAVRAAGCEPARVAVIVNLYPMHNLVLHGWRLDVDLPRALYRNVLYDVHLYYAFLPATLSGSLPLGVVTGAFVWAQTALLGLAGRRTFVGEWSLKLPWAGRLALALERLAPRERELAYARLAASQLDAMGAQGSCVGFAYWTLNAPDSQAEWSLMTSLRSGYFSLGGSVPGGAAAVLGALPAAVHATARASTKPVSTVWWAVEMCVRAWLGLVLTMLGHAMCKARGVGCWIAVAIDAVILRRLF